MAGLPWFRTISPTAGKISPGIMCTLRFKGSLANWIVNRDELGAVGKCCFYFDFRNHLRNAFQNLIAGHDLAAIGHECRNRFAVARTLHDEIRYKRHTFGIIELDASCEPTSSDRRRNRDHELVFFTRCEVHELLRSVAFSTSTFLVRKTDPV